MSDVTISHSHEDGTLVDGTERGDGCNEILKRYGFRWFPSIKQFGIRNSRDRVAQRATINAAAEALRAAGHTVTVEIDDEVRDNETVKAARHERLEDRRAALTRKGEKLAAEGDALYKASNAMVEHIPMGQPVMPGRRGRAHRNLLERSVNTAIRGAQASIAAQQMPARVEASRRAEARAERPDVVHRRVEKMRADLRRLDRQMAMLKLYPETGSTALREQYEAQRALLLERIAGDEKTLEQARAEGRYGLYSKENVHKDDRVLIRGQWRTVARANPKSVSVTTGYSWTDKYGWEEVRGLKCEHAPAADSTADTDS